MTDLVTVFGFMLFTVAVYAGTGLICVHLHARWTRREKVLDSLVLDRLSHAIWYSAGQLGLGSRAEVRALDRQVVLGLARADTVAYFDGVLGGTRKVYLLSDRGKKYRAIRKQAELEFARIDQSAEEADDGEE